MPPGLERQVKEAIQGGKMTISGWIASPIEEMKSDIDIHEKYEELSSKDFNVYEEVAGPHELQGDICIDGALYPHRVEGLGRAG